jgi:Family of unknown function (DUF6054)
MVTQTFFLNGEDIEATVINFTRNYYPQAYESNYPGGFLRVYEEYSFLNSNQLMVCIRVDTTNAAKGEITIEVISGGSSGSPFFKGWWGSEKRRIKNFGKALEEFCYQENIRFEAQ